MRCAVALLVLLAPALVSASTPLLDLYGLSSPLLIWSNRGTLGQELAGPRVSYQVVSDVHVTSDVVLGALGKLTQASALDQLLDLQKLAGEQHNALVVYLGNELDLAALRGSSAPTSRLSDLLEAAASSLVVPYTSAQEHSLTHSLKGKLTEAMVSFKLLGCDSPLSASDLASQVGAALQSASSAQQVLLVCAPTAGNGGLEEEVEGLAAVHAAVEQGADSALFVYAVGSQSGARRRLQDAGVTAATYTGFGQYQTCGVLCQTQVRWLEGMLVLLFLALGTCSGLLCLYFMDTPTRFEVPKEAPVNN